MNKFVLRVILPNYDRPLFLSDDVLPKLTPVTSRAKVFSESDANELKYTLPEYVHYLNRTYFPQHYGEILNILSLYITEEEHDK